jgi:Holliday junction resolvasome RuvABC ATP-dependent DNA helicase subunit
MQAGFLHRTKQGRITSRDAWLHLGLAPPEIDEQLAFALDEPE